MATVTGFTAARMQQIEDLILIPGITNGQIPVWNNAAGKFNAGSYPAGASELNYAENTTGVVNTANTSFTRVDLDGLTFIVSPNPNIVWLESAVMFSHTPSGGSSDVVLSIYDITGGGNTLVASSAAPAKDICYIMVPLKIRLGAVVAQRIFQVSFAIIIRSGAPVCTALNGNGGAAANRSWFTAYQK